MNKEYFDTSEEMHKAVANHIYKKTTKSSSPQKFKLAISGGKTPIGLFKILRKEYSKNIPWDRIHLFWVDERLVPITSEFSNYGVAKRVLLNRISIPASNVHPMRTDYINGETAAKNYELTLRDFFEGNDPGFDLVILGMGTDGHTASLFPKSDTLKEKECWVRSVNEINAEPAIERITLTYPLLEDSSQIFIMISGNEKIKLLNTIEELHEDTYMTYPVLKLGLLEKSIWFIGK